jgi:hypothetical protein
MKLALATAAVFACLMPVAAFAQDAPAADAAAPAAVKLDLDTPIETLAADERSKAVLDADLPELLPHPSYDMFKGMSLRQLQPMSEGKLTDEMLAKVEADLAKIH